MALSIMGFLGLGALAALFCNVAVFALPTYVGFSAGLWAVNTGAGIGGVVIGFGAGLAVLRFGQIAFAWSRSLLIRWLLVFLFAAPAAWAGYSIVLEVSELGVPSYAWRQVVAAIAGVAAAGTAVARLRALPTEPRRAPRRAATGAGRPRPTCLQKFILAAE
jgi:hypothetical protein